MINVLSAPRTWNTPDKNARLANGWAGLVEGLSSPFQFGSGSGGYEQLSQPDTWIANMAAAPFTLQYSALTFGYMTYGLAQTLVDQPVDDAFKGGLVIKIPEMKPKDIARLQKRIRKARVIAAMKEGIKWARLFGGGGLIIATDQNPGEPMDVQALADSDTNLRFIPFNRWEVTTPRISVNGYAIPGRYLYFGESLDWSRVIRISGRPAPYPARNMLQGWGQSELERCIREIQLYIKFQTVLFELVDEAKVDIYRLLDLNSMLQDATGTQAAILRVTMANLIKNYKNAIVLDSTDEYEQKTMTFAGLADICEQLRINLAGALRIPVNKLFGQSATGFASGEDAMENYNALVESDIREPAGPMIDDVLSLCMMQEFGYVPEFTAEFNPLRIVDPEAEERIKASKQARILALRQADQITGEEADNLLHQEGLISIDTEVGSGREPLPAWDQADEPESDTAAEGGDKKKNGHEAPRGSPQWNAERYAWLKTEAKKGNFGAWFKRQLRNADTPGVPQKKVRQDTRRSAA